MYPRDGCDGQAHHILVWSANAGAARQATGSVSACRYRLNCRVPLLAVTDRLSRGGGRVRPGLAVVTPGRQGWFANRDVRRMLQQMPWWSWRPDWGAPKQVPTGSLEAMARA